MSRTHRKKRRPLPLKQVLFSALAVLAALFVLSFSTRRSEAACRCPARTT